MALSARRLMDIVDAAATLAERIAWGAAGAPSSADADRRTDHVLDRWRAAVAGGDSVRWQRRLEWDGYDDAMVRRALASRVSPARVPEWAMLLDEASRLAPQLSLGNWPGAQFAFADLLVPFLATARRRVAARVNRAGTALAPSARADLEAALLQQLSDVAKRTLFDEFALFRAAEGGGARAVLSSALHGGSRRIYDAFVHRHLDDGLETLLGSYPVLARLLGTRTLFWVQNTGAFLDRLTNDWDAIRAAFAIPVASTGDSVVRIEANRSDPHRGAQAVAVLTFASGVRVVYKPRSLSIDRCLYDLYAWLNERHGGLHLRGLRLVERRGYGWVEFARVEPCATPEEVDNYFERGGMLLALAYVLGASDLHSANVLACGEHPALIDLEVMFNPLVDTGVAPERDGRRFAQESVLATALLPTRTSGPGADYLDGGLLNRSTLQTYRRETVRFPNTDMMVRGHFEFVGGAPNNVPMLNEQPSSTRLHVAALRRGFARMYDTLLAHRDELLAENGSLRAFADATVRVVFRPTSIYEQVNVRTLNARFMRSGVERSVELERLKAPALAAKSRPPVWSLLAAEQRELEQLDVPVFSTRPSTRTLWSGGGAHAESGLVESGWKRVVARMRALGTADRGRQLDLIRLSFAAADDYFARLTERGAPVSKSGTEDGLMEAVRIGEALIAMRSELGELSWLGVVGPDGERGLDTLDVNLFEGTAGVSVFFAALSRLTGRGDFRSVAEDTMRPIRHELRDDADRDALADRIGIGGAHGIASLAYAFTRVATFLDDASYFDDARAAITAISEERIARDDKIDVTFGSSGALLSMLALYRATGDSEVLCHARRCARHLLATQLAPGHAHAGHWLTGDAIPQTSFAHGTAGIVAALARLHSVESSHELRDAIARGLNAIENSFDANAGTWRDKVVADESTDEAWCSWCHGAAGIGFAYLGVDEDDGANRAIAAALKAAAERNHPSTDGLCCGTSGRIDFLLTAGVRLGRQDLVTIAREKSARLRRERVTRGSYRTGFVTELSPGLFQGVAGIGYGMLRTARPDAVPSVLNWE